MALYDAKGKELHIKVRRGGRRFSPRWAFSVCGLMAAALGLSLFWQHVQHTPLEVSAIPQESSAVESGAPQHHSPVVVDAQARAQAAAEAAKTVGVSAKDWSVPYQVPESEAVEASYFDDAVFVGDSITTGISLYRTMANAQVVAATGINPNTILKKPVIRDEEGALHTVLDALAAKKPGKIYLLLGANGVAFIGQDTFIERYGELVDAIMEQNPKATLYVQSIFPVTLEKSLGENGIYANEKIDRYNEALMELCREKGLPYLNVAEALRGHDGALPAGASSDGIHIGPATYETWFDYLRTHTARPGGNGGEQAREDLGGAQRI